MINGLGRRIIGEERAKQNKTRHRQPVNGLGRRILGDIKKPPVDDDVAPPSNPFIAAADASGDGYISLAELRAKLEAEPQLLPLAIEAEEMRDKPRTPALAIFARVRAQQSAPTDQKPTPPAAGMTITQATEALDKNPAAVGDLLTAELGRAEGPRQPLLLRLREVEQQRPDVLGGPRADLLALIDEAMDLAALIN